MNRQELPKGLTAQFLQQREAICAPATPLTFGKGSASRSAIAIIRATGSHTKNGTPIFSALGDTFKTQSGKTAAALKPRISHYGLLAAENYEIDDVVFIRFDAPASFTGEDAFEIHCHGNPLIVENILQLLLRLGFRMATPGEFTRRAYLNGKLALDAAQAISEIIDAQSAEALKAARRLKSGSFRHELLQLRSDLMNLSADLNAELDFIDEDIAFATLDTKLKIVRSVRERALKLKRDAERFDALRGGVHIAIVGPPNAGKSSLMNRLLGEERAIVSEIAGTTRDYLDAELELAGFNVRLFDTAGLRESDDAIEKIGIERTRTLMQRAHIIVNLHDGGASKAALHAHADLPDTAVVVDAINKEDSLSPVWRALRQTAYNNLIFISAKTGTGIDSLLEQLSGLIRERAPQEALPLNAWQQQVLGEIATGLENTLLALTTHELPEIIAHTVGTALEHIAELSGDISNDDILGRIFSRFCIGK